MVSNEQIQFKNELSILFTEYEARWQPIGMHELQKTTEQGVFHFRNSMMHLVSHVSEVIWRSSSRDTDGTNISEQVHIGNVEEASRFTNKVKYISQMVKLNDESSHLGYEEEALLYHTLQGWYCIDLVEVFDLLSTTNTRQKCFRAHQLPLQHCQDEPCCHPVSAQVYHSRETPVCGVSRRIKHQQNVF